MPRARKGNQYFGELNGQLYQIQDDQAANFYRRWAGLSPVALVQDVLRDYGFWEADMHSLPGFERAVIEKLNLLISLGVREAIETVRAKKVYAA